MKCAKCAIVLESAMPDSIDIRLKNKGGGKGDVKRKQHNLTSDICSFSFFFFFFGGGFSIHAWLYLSQQAGRTSLF